MEEIKLWYATIHYDAPIVYIDLKEGTELGFPEINELTRHAEKLADQKPYFVLTHLHKNVNLTNEGKRVAAEAKTAPLHKGTALLVDSTMYMIAANFFNNFRKPEFPFKVFTEKQKAIDWLQSLSLN